MEWVLGVTILGFCALVGLIVWLGYQERRELHSRLMAIEHPQALSIKHNVDTSFKEYEAEVDYVDDERALELIKSDS